MRCGKHVRPQQPSLVGQLDAHFRGARIRIEQFGYVGDTTRQPPIRIGIQLDFGPVADVIFIRRALRDSLRRTLARFAVEAEDEAGLR